ncbi:MAG: hypothetical protein WCO09_03290 [bacterium]
MDELNTNGGAVADANTAPVAEVEATVDSEGTHPTTEGADAVEVVATPVAPEATVEAEPTAEVVETPAAEEVAPEVAA